MKKTVVFVVGVVLLALCSLATAKSVKLLDHSVLS